MIQIKELCKAMIKTSKENKTDVKDYVREFIQFIEKVKLENWDRDYFLTTFTQTKLEEENKYE